METLISWRMFADAAPDLAAFGAERLASGIAYLATIRRDGAPRIHPVTPIFGHGHLFVFMEPASPKSYDLRRDSRYALHARVGEPSSGSGEFLLNGQALLIDDPVLWQAAADSANYSPPTRSILFELGVEMVVVTMYRNGQPVRQHWGKD